MQAQTDSNPVGYIVILVGLFLSAVSAVVPHFQAGYNLMASVLFTGMLPYIVYGITVPLLRSTLMTVAGLVLVVAHGWLVLTQRIAGNGDYSDGTIYFVPIVLSVLLLPLVGLALKQSGLFGSSSVAQNEPK